MFISLDLQDANDCLQISRSAAIKDFSLCTHSKKVYLCTQNVQFHNENFFFWGGVKLALHYSKAVYTLPESHDTESVMKILTQNFRFLYHCKDM